MRWSHSNSYFFSFNAISMAQRDGDGDAAVRDENGFSLLFVGMCVCVYVTNNLQTFFKWYGFIPSTEQTRNSISFVWWNDVRLWR